MARARARARGFIVEWGVVGYGGKECSGLIR